MTRTEFAKGILYLSAGIDKEMDPKRVDVYFDLLGNLDYDTFIAACRVVLLRHVWATFPSAAEIKQSANELSSGNELTSGEAWAMAREAALSIDPDMAGPHRVYHGNGKFIEYPSQAASVLKELPAPVVKAIEVFGLRELCIADSPDGVMRAQFTKVFESLQDREKRKAMLPPIVKAAIEKQRDEERGRVAVALAGIGEMNHAPS